MGAKQPPPGLPDNKAKSTPAERSVTAQPQPVNVAPASEQPPAGLAEQQQQQQYQQRLLMRHRQMPPPPPGMEAGGHPGQPVPPQYYPPAFMHHPTMGYGPMAYPPVGYGPGSVSPAMAALYQREGQPMHPAHGQVVMPQRQANF